MFQLRKSSSRTGHSIPEKRSFYLKKTDQGYVRSSEKRQNGEDIGRDDWLISYADAMTLLLVFFILLFSFSEIDQARFEEIQQGIQTTLLQREASRPFAEVKEAIQLAILEHELDEFLTVTSHGLGLQLSFASSLLYESGSAEIKQMMNEPLYAIAQTLKTLDKQTMIIEVEGHTDDVPIRSALYASNWELSAHRATNIVRFFERAGIPEQQLRAIAYGETRPIKPNRDALGNPIPEHQASNRRVVVQVRRARLSE